MGQTNEKETWGVGGRNITVHSIIFICIGHTLADQHDWTKIISYSFHSLQFERIH